MRGIEAMNEQLSKIVKEFDDPKRFAGVLLVGSEARGDASLYSDVDIVFYAFEEPSDEHEKYRLTYRKGRLISLSIKTLSAARAAFSNPVEAIPNYSRIKRLDCLVRLLKRGRSQVKAGSTRICMDAEITSSRKSRSQLPTYGKCRRGP